MRILAFTDLHDREHHFKELKRKAKNADCIICAGDFTIFERDYLRIAKDLAKLGKPLFLIHGNHESKELIERLGNLFSNIIPVHNKLVDFQDITIFGYGGLGFIETAPEFERDLKKIEKELSSAKKLVFVTHQPPYNTVCDEIGYEHVGNKSFLNFDKKFKPLIHICGHIEENSYRKQMLGRTLLINPGPEGRFLTIKNNKEHKI